MSKGKIVIEYDGARFTVSLHRPTRKTVQNICNSPRYDDAIRAADIAFDRFGGALPIIDNVAEGGSA